MIYSVWYIQHQAGNEKINKMKKAPADEKSLMLYFGKTNKFVIFFENETLLYRLLT